MEWVVPETVNRNFGGGYGLELRCNIAERFDERVRDHHQVDFCPIVTSES